MHLGQGSPRTRLDRIQHDFVVVHGGGGGGLYCNSEQQLPTNRLQFPLILLLLRAPLPLHEEVGAQYLNTAPRLPFSGSRLFAVAVQHWPAKIANFYFSTS